MYTNARRAMCVQKQTNKSTCDEQRLKSDGENLPKAAVIPSKLQSCLITQNRDSPAVLFGYV